MNKFERNKVAVDSLVDQQGMTQIYDILYTEIKKKDSGIYGVNYTKLSGGRLRVNNQGKMTKRIKRNMRRDYDVALDDKVIEQIGNIMEKHSMSASEYIVEYTTDLKGTVGNFGDKGTCFRRGGECRNNLVAMHDQAGQEPGTFAAFRVYRASGSNLGRAWAYHAEGGEIVLFNGYGMALDKIALLAAKLDDTEPRLVRVEGDVYINDENRSWAIGGKDTRYYIQANPGNYGSDDDTDPCSHCERFCPSGDITIVEHDYLCPDCFNENYQICNHCGDYCSRVDRPLFRVLVRGSTRHVCERCRNASYTKCDGCDNYHYIASYAPMTQIGESNYCQSCAIERGGVKCYDCSKITMPDDTFLIQYSTAEKTSPNHGLYSQPDYPVCVSCRMIYHECDNCGVDLPWKKCPNCNAETTPRTPTLDFDISKLESREAQSRHDRNMINATLRFMDNNPKVSQEERNDALTKLDLAQTRIGIFQNAIVRARAEARLRISGYNLADRPVIRI